MPRKPEPAPEFSRPVAVLDLEPGATTMEIAAEPAERAALAKRFELLELKRLEARLTLRPVAGAAQVFVTGHFEAELVQSCVVTLEPVDSAISAEFDCAFAAAGAEDEDAELDIGWDEEDPPEPIVDGKIDLGEAVAERLGLEIDPFPRAPGAEFAGFKTGEGAEGAGAPANPFSVLAKIWPRKG